MPRRRRTMTKSPGRRKRPADWVYRMHIRDEAGGLSDALGSYEFTFATLVAGQANSQVRILYDSFNYVNGRFPDIGGGNTPGFLLPAPARAEGKNPLIHRVQGEILVRPSSWAITNAIFIGFRFGIFEQDPLSGLVLLDPGYTIINPSATSLLNPGLYANTRDWQHERRIWDVFESNTNRWHLRFNFPVRRTLKPHECYAVYAEGNGASSVNCVVGYQLRTLVSDEG